MSRVAILIASTVIAALVVVFGAKVLLMKPNRDQSGLAREVMELIGRAGGTNEVFKEADQIFTRFGTQRVKVFLDSEKKDFPAISALGKLEEIEPGYPAHIQVRVGGHLNGYLIAILPTNNGTLIVPDAVEVVRWRIYAHR